jgi:TonB family protein
MLRRFLVVALTLATRLAVASVSTSGSHSASRTFDQRELQVSRALTHAAQFVDVPHINARACEQAADPVALVTPDPLLTTSAHPSKVRVSFIIGTDGRVHSPLILESAGMAGDRRVLETVRHWKYRPATCNGVPTETEGKIEFSIP